MFRKLLNNLYGLYFGAVFVVVVTPALILIAVVPGFERRRWIARHTARLIFRLAAMPLEVHDLDRIPRGSSVVVANHASYLDGIVLTAVLPPVFSFVIKREVTRVPAMHLLLRRLGSQFVERYDLRKGAADARRVLRTAGSGQALAFFPEGTFRCEPGLRRFHAGAFVAAARAELEVVPVAITGTRDILPADRNLPRPGRITVKVLPPVPAATNGRSDAPKLRDCARSALLEELGEPDLAHAPPTKGARAKAGPA
ncbi:MAG: lysophospholipid acyltransferase family protein [Gammaproteobacteria bacterium]